MERQKVNYERPEVDILEVCVEGGIAVSPTPGMTGSIFYDGPGGDDINF